MSNTQPSASLFNMGGLSLGIKRPTSDHYNRREFPVRGKSPSRVSLLALLAALLAQHAWPVKGRQPLPAFYGRLAMSAAKRLNAGDRNSGILAWLALMGAVLVPVALVAALAAAIHPVVLWALDVLFLYATLRFLQTASRLAAIERALREGEGTSAAIG